jgi:predicted GTPase
VSRKKLIICGAAGRDFHNFNLLYRGNPEVEVVAFTATQIPNIENRRYPPELAGPLYPQGVPIHPEAELTALIERHAVDEIQFAYSDVSHEWVMHLASRALAAGASFSLASPAATMLESERPVVSICAVRTGSGKSQTSRAVAGMISGMGRRVVVVRHPMPYGDLVAQRVQRLASVADMDRFQCTIEEREEYELHLEQGRVVFAGVDYEQILRAAEAEADVVLWEGGNNDTPFFRPDLEIVVADPHRAGHELAYHPGETNLLRADVVIVNKVDSARPEDVLRVEENVRRHNPRARLLRARSALKLDAPERIRGRRVLVIEDGPTLTHGGMKYGAGVVAARENGAAAIVDPRPWTVGTIAETFRAYPEIGPLLPAMGYGEEQIRDLEETIRRVDCDVVVIATPLDLGRLIRLEKPAVRVRYELEEASRPGLREILAERFGPPASNRA